MNMENATLTSYCPFPPRRNFSRYFHVLRNNCIVIELREIKESIHLLNILVNLCTERTIIFLRQSLHCIFCHIETTLYALAS